MNLLMVRDKCQAPGICSDESSGNDSQCGRDRNRGLGRAFGFKTREKVIDVGLLHASKDETHNVPYGPIAGALLAIGGVVLLVKSKS